ncbi:hypothetical protein [Tessaracoccus caeni]|uniref:hypothetical protein n=1 Tax=Tessaracoccus caeni TaxID=3031239 RepID=UPI0023D9ED3C|nr:hypothetical protein [Tessaracoccus caeni]MDF1488387.1 hypothetical protein [Tessaracoccus caeni]
MRPLRPRKIAPAAVALVCLGLAGCSEPAAAPTEQVSPTQQVSPSVEASAPETGATTDAPTTGLVEPEVDRSGSYSTFRNRLLTFIDEKLDCETGEVVIGGDVGDVQVTAGCPIVTVHGDNAYVVTENVGELTVAGDSNIVVARGVGLVVVSGSDNVVHWQGAALDATASDDGNTLLQHEEPVEGEPAIEIPFQHGTDLPTEFDPESLMNENYKPSS